MKVHIINGAVFVENNDNKTHTYKITLNDTLYKECSIEGESREIVYKIQDLFHYEKGKNSITIEQDDKAVYSCKI